MKINTEKLILVISWLNVALFLIVIQSFIFSRDVQAHKLPISSASQLVAQSSKDKDGGLDGKPIDIGHKGSYQCGNLKGENAESNFKTKFNFGCLGPKAPANMHPIVDLILAFIRFFTIGVGIVITGALILAGIQYSASEGNPDASAKAKKRVQNAIIGLMIFIFAWAIMQFIVPGGVFKG